MIELRSRADRSRFVGSRMVARGEGGREVYHVSTEGLLDRAAYEARGFRVRFLRTEYTERTLGVSEPTRIYELTWIPERHR